MNTHPDLPNQTPVHGRRHLIAAALAGTAAALPAMRASANDTTTTTAPPRRAEADVALLNAALQSERGLVALYLALYTGGDLSGDEAAVVLAVHDNHKAYVDALVGYLGPDAAADSGIAASAPQGTFAAVAAQLADAESRAVGGHLATMAAVRGVEAAALLASIVSVEARQHAAMAILSGQPASSATS